MHPAQTAAALAARRAGPPAASGVGGTGLLTTTRVQQTLQQVVAVARTLDSADDTLGLSSPDQGSGSVGLGHP